MLSNQLTFEQQKKNTGINVVLEFPKMNFFVLESSYLTIPVLTQMEEIKSDLLVNNWEIDLPKKPFDIKYNDFIKLNITEIKEYYKEVKLKFKEKIEKEWRDGIKQIVICKNEIVYTTKEINPIDNKKIKEISEKYDSACYVFNAPLFVEESSWSDCFEDAPYPTIELYIGSSESELDEILKKK